MAREKHKSDDEINQEIIHACSEIAGKYLGYPQHVIVYALLIYPINLLRGHAPNKEAAIVYLEGVIKRQLEYLEERINEREKKNGNI